MAFADETKTRAEAYRLELELGLTSVSDIVSWADSLVARDPAPHVALVELALAGGRATWELADLLKDVPGDSCDPLVQKLVFSRLHDVLRERPEEFARCGSILLSIATGGRACSRETANELCDLEVRLELAQSGGVGTMQELKVEVLEFCERMSR